MDRKVLKIERTESAMPTLKRVAAYARVSSGKDTMLHSLSAQVSYYNDLIRSHPEWTLAGVYADEAKTGTKDSRPEFARLIVDCRNGLVDMIVTKSVSRFARNTVTTLETVRELKELGIDVLFEEQKIHTLSSDGELMLTILAGFAEEESRSVSENMKWRIRKNFEEGKPWGMTLIGYRYKNGQLVIEENEARTVRRIFDEYLSGKGTLSIANGLNRDGVSTRDGCKWYKTTVSWILTNYTYTGSLLLQKTYREDYRTKKKRLNTGELPMYQAMETHQAIVSSEEFEAVAKRLEAQAAKHAPRGKDYTQRYPFSSKIVCGICGKSYRRKVTATGPVWICATYNTKGKSFCPSKQIPEKTLMDLFADTDLDSIDKAIANNGNELVTVYKDGTQETRRWRDRSRAESWTPEMREKARQRTQEQMKHEK